MIISGEFLDLGKVLDEAMQALDGAVAHLLLPPPDQHQTLPVASPCPFTSRPSTSHPKGLVYNSESDPDSDDDMEQDLPWRDIQGIPSFHVMNIMKYAPQPPDCIEHDILDIENGSYLLSTEYYSPS